MSTGEPDATEIGHVRFGGGSSEKDQVNWHLAGGLPYGTHGSEGGSAGQPAGPTRHSARRPGLFAFTRRGLTVVGPAIFSHVYNFWPLWTASLPGTFRCAQQ